MSSTFFGLFLAAFVAAMYTESIKKKGRENKNKIEIKKPEKSFEEVKKKEK